MVAVPSRGRADAGLHHVAPEAAATRELYERHAAKIFAFCLGRLRDREEAEDATQSTFLNAFRGLQRGIAPEHEQAWLYKIAENVCLTRQRSRLRRRRVESPGDLDALQDVIPSPSYEPDELLQLPAALQGMPEQQRRALLLREWQGLSYREIADELDLSQAAVETLLFRARRSLAEGLSEEPPKKRRLVARLGDTSSLAALLKTLFFSSGAKVVVAAVVAAGTLVAGSAGVRHSLEDVVVPHAHVAAPVQHAGAPVRHASRAVAPPVVLHHAVVAPKAAHRATIVRTRHHGRAQRHVHVVVPAAVPVLHRHPQRPAAVSHAQPARAPRHVAAVTHARSAGHHASAPAAKREHPATPPAQARHRGGNGNGTGAVHQSSPPPSSQGHGNDPAPAAQPAPVDQVTGAVTDTEHGLGNAVGHLKK